MMEQQLIKTLTTSFEGHAQHTDSGIAFSLARDLQHLLGYGKWVNFLGVISKAKTACELSGHSIDDHFADVGKMVDLGSGSQRDISDIMLTRYACYLIAQNGDSRKQEIAFAQNMHTEGQISGEHVTNNQAVRQTLLSRGITPENLPAAEDVKKVERRLTSSEKQAVQKPAGLGRDGGCVQQTKGEQA